MNKQFTWKFVVVLISIALAVWSLLTNGIKQGLDLKGGTSFLMQMDLSNIDASGRAQAQQQAVETIRRRMASQ